TDRLNVLSESELYSLRPKPSLLFMIDRLSRFGTLTSTSLRGALSPTIVDPSEKAVFGFSFLWIFSFSIRWPGLLEVFVLNSLTAIPHISYFVKEVNQPRQAEKEKTASEGDFLVSFMANNLSYSIQVSSSYYSLVSLSFPQTSRALTGTSKTRTGT
ncbi:Ras-related protein Rab-8A, partial [Striga asiatica]